MNTRVNLREVNFICIFYLNIVLLLKKIKWSKKGRIRVRGVALMRNKYGKEAATPRFIYNKTKEHACYL